MFTIDFLSTYERTRRDLEAKGITSFSGYLTSMMEEIMTKYETFSRHAPFMEKLMSTKIELRLKTIRKRIAEVFLKDDKLRCSLDESIDCAHIGFVYSLPNL